MKRREYIIGSVFVLCLLIGCAETVPYNPGTSWAENGIASLEEVALNGLRHNVLIRGTNLKNPVLLFVHAMGVPSMPFAHLEYASTGAPTEQQFTVVHYDQRGFGKTYRNGKRSRRFLHVEQYIRDAEALIRHLKTRFHKERIYLIGESWGSVIAMHLAARHPDWFYAYIGAGQVSNVMGYLSDLYDYCENKARTNNDQKAPKALSRPGRPVSTMSDKELFKSLMQAGDLMDKYQAQETGLPQGAGFFFKALWEAPEYSIFDFQATLTGYKRTQKKLIKEMLSVDLEKQVPAVPIPVTFVMGEHDLWRNQTEKYFEHLKAPNKRLVVFPKAGHMVRGDASEAFIDLLLSIKQETYSNTKSSK